MQVRDGMSTMVLTVGPGHTLRQAAPRWPSAASAPPSCSTPRRPGLGILTERDILHSLGEGQDPDTEQRRRPPDRRPRLRRARTGRSSRAPPRWSAAASAT